MSYVCFPCSSIGVEYCSIELTTCGYVVYFIFDCSFRCSTIKFTAYAFQVTTVILHMDLYFTFRTFCYKTAVVRGIFPEVLTGQFMLLHLDILLFLYLSAVFVLSSLDFN